MNRTTRMLCGLLCLVPLWGLGQVVGVGSPVDEVIAEFGDPEMRYSRDGDTILYYLGLEVVVRDGKVVRMPARLSDRIATNRGERQAQAALRNQERARASSNTARVAAVPRSAAKTATHGGARVISQGGAEVDTRTLLKPGRVTVVDFYADWCGPCRQLAPHLEQLATGNAAVDLVKVDIVKWGTPVTRQYKIKSVPNVRVYDASGTMIGKPSHDLSTIRKNLARATGS